MNLHGIVAGRVGAVNPQVAATIKASTGYTTNGDGSQVPTYATPQAVTIQVQPLAWKDLQQLEGINVQGEKRAVFFNGANWDAVSRVDQKGGDLLTFFDPDAPNGGGNRTWLLTQVLEKWPDWVKVAVTLQNDP